MNLGVHYGYTELTPEGESRIAKEVIDGEKLWESAGFCVFALGIEDGVTESRVTGFR